jgi:ATP/maltotriose-dependent transcriptional regulator MalT
MRCSRSPSSTAWESCRDAAKRLFISAATVKTHVLHIFAKLVLNDRATAVAAGFSRC